MAKTTKLFLTPPGWPNAIDIDHDQKRGFWVQEQRHDNKPEAAWLIDWNGKLLHTVMTNCKDTSGMCFGGGYVWSGANGASEMEHPTPPINGIFQTDMNGKQISHRQIPFGPKDDGGATHGMTWQPDDGKIWIDSNRLEAMIRIDPKTWEVDYMFPTTRVPGLAERLHGIAYDNGFIWQVTGHQKEGTAGYEGYTPGLIKYESRPVKSSRWWSSWRAPVTSTTSRCITVNFTELTPESIPDGRSTSRPTSIPASRRSTAHRAVMFSASI